MTRAGDLLGTASVEAARRWGYSHRRELAAGVGLLGVAIAVLWSPAIGLALILGSIVALARNRASAASIAAVLWVVALFAWMNANKAVAGDWVWYSQHYLWVYEHGLGHYFGENIEFIRSGDIYYVSPEPTEPAYYVLAWIVAHTSGGNITTLSVVVTVAIYGVLGGAVVALLRSLAAGAWTSVAAVASALMFGPLFTVSTQLVRQEIATACVALGLVLLFLRRPWGSGIAFLLATLTHNSAAIPIAAAVLAYLLASRFRPRLSFVAGIFGVFALLGFAYLVSEGDARYQGVSDGQISPWVIGFDVALTCVFILTVWRSPHSTLPFRAIAYLSPALAGFLVGVSSQPLPFLRMYFHFDLARALMIICLIVLAARTRRFRPLAGTLGALAFVYLGIRMALSPFDYGGTFVHYVFAGGILASG